MDNLLLFTMALVAIYLVPGPDMILVLRTTVTGFVFDLAYALLGRGLWALTAENVRYQKAQNNVFALLMMGIGLKIALS